jgi:hypothetical protein
MLFAHGPAHAQWLLGWTYRCPVTVANPCGEEIVGCQVRVRLDSTFEFGHAQADGSDLRFTGGDGTTLIPYWIEQWDPGTEQACIWVKHPSLPPAGDTIYIYYGDLTATAASNGHETFDAYDGFEDYTSGNPGEWSRYEGNPLIKEGSPGAWDDHGATFATVIWDSAAGEYRMYYHGFSFSGVHQIGLATASSPEGPWTKYPGNPVVTPGPAAWDAAHVRVPWVWKEGPDDYRLIYTGANSGNDYQVGYATSTDGITWTKHPSNPVFNCPYWAHNDSESWGIMKYGSEYHMWYTSRAVREIGLAVSTDLVSWSPHTTTPIYASSGDPGDDLYNHYCPDIFRYGGVFYMLICNYNSTYNYGKLYLYSCPNPYFAEADRHLVRIAHTVGSDGEWDDHDSDTPFVFTLDIERTAFYNNELWCYYAAEEGSNLFGEGLLIESDIAEALSDTPLPGTLGAWTAEGDVTPVESPVHQGMQSVRQHDPSTGGATRLSTSFSQKERAVIGAWMRRNSTSVGDYDTYIYEDQTLACAAGLGRDGVFHYWNGDFQNTGISWALDTWYLVTLAFDATTDSFDLVVFDEEITEVMREEGISFANPVSYIDRVMFYTSVGYAGDCHADDFRVRAWCGSGPIAVAGDEEIDPAVAVPDNEAIPKACVLYQNYPNPFNPVTEIRYDLTADGPVSLAIYNTLGQRVVTLVHGHQKTGVRTARWNGKDLRGRSAASGIYFYRLEAGSYTETKKMIMLR